ncbi:MAG TPA: alpha/beta hydrolase [Kofleriaceae bacterium]|jgi:pimeloyl-ACP methyl ester carboxylesterase
MVFVQQRHVVARDGTRIGYQVHGEGPCVVLANGLGGTHVTWKYFYDALAVGYRTICWDYRGLFTSDAPADPHAIGMADHVSDLIAILDHEGVTEVVIVGWSMGVQVAIETFRRHRGRVRGMFLVDGTYGRTFSTVLGSRLIGQTIPMLLRLVRAQAALVGRATQRLAGSQALIAAMKRVGLVSETIDLDVFRAVAASFVGVDWRIYSDMLLRLDEHDAEDVLATIDVPVAIAVGDRDLMTPPATAEHMHRTIRGSRLVVIAGGTHYTPVEYPAILVDELARLLARVPGWDKRVAA